MISLMSLKYPKLAKKKIQIFSSIILFQVPRLEMVMSVSFDSSCRTLKQDIIIVLNFIVLCSRGRGNFLMNLSMGPGGSFENYHYSPGV